MTRLRIIVLLAFVLMPSRPAASKHRPSRITSASQSSSGYLYVFLTVDGKNPAPRPRLLLDVGHHQRQPLPPVVSSCFRILCDPNEKFEKTILVAGNEGDVAQEIVLSVSTPAIYDRSTQAYPIDVRNWILPPIEAKPVSCHGLETSAVAADAGHKRSSPDDARRPVLGADAR